MFVRLKQIGWGSLFGILIAFQALGPAFAQTATLLPNAKQQFFSDTGVPLASGTVDFFIPSTNTRKTTWKSSTESVGNQNTNPVALDAAGRALIYGDGSYRQVVKDADGNTIWDAVTASTGGGSSGGTPSSEGVMVGTIIPWANLTLPSKYLYAAGQAIVRATYPDLVTAITFQPVILCQTGVGTITVSGDISDKTPIGAPIEASCFAPGTTVTAKASGQLTLSTNATTTVSVTAIIFPWGNGDGSTTFNVPDLRGRVIAGRDNMNGSIAGVLTSAFYQTPALVGVNPDAINAVAGNQSHTQLVAELATHNHPVFLNDPGHQHGITGSVVSNSGGGTGINVLNGSSLTSAAFTGITVRDAALGGGTANQTATTGSSTPFTIVQPTATADYIIKALPDDSPTGPGVSSIQGMTGAIACGSGMTCTANTISALGNISVGVSPIVGGTTGFVLSTTAGILSQIAGSTTVNGQNCALGGSCTITASAGTITPGVTTIASGTDKGLLYDNAGVLGNLATGNSGVLVTSGAGVPSISTTLPSTLTIPSPTFTGTVAGAGTIPSSVLANTAVTPNTYGSSTAIPTIIVNQQGQITGASSNFVVAPAGTLTGTTLASGVVTSSLTTVGTIATGVWNGTAVDLSHGGTNNSLAASNGGILWSDASKLNILSGTVTAGQCLLSGSSTAPTWGSCAGGATVTSIAGNTGAFTVAAGVTNATNQIQADGNYSGFALPNCTIAASVSLSVLTVALKDNGGSNPSATSPCYINYRNVTVSTGSTTLVAQTGALSIDTNAAGASLGALNTTAFRFWVVSFNNGGTNVLALINCSTSNTIFPLRESLPASTTPMSASATSAGVFYTPNGTTVTSKSFRILGYVEYNSTGLVAAGTYTRAPDFIQNFGPGIKLPGSIVQTSTSSTITPTSAANLIKVSLGISWNIQTTVNTNCTLLRNSSISIAFLTSATFSNTAITPCTFANVIDKPNSTSSTGYSASFTTGSGSNNYYELDEVQG